MKQGQGHGILGEEGRWRGLWTVGEKCFRPGAASAKALGQHELRSFQRHRAAKASGRVRGEGRGEVPSVRAL